MAVLTVEGAACVPLGGGRGQLFLITQQDVGGGAKGLSCQEQLEKATVTTAAGPQSHPRSATSLGPWDSPGRRQNPMLWLRERKPREGPRPSPGSHSRPGTQPKPVPPTGPVSFLPTLRPQLEQSLTAHTMALSESLLPPETTPEDKKTRKVILSSLENRGRRRATGEGDSHVQAAALCTR